MLRVIKTTIATIATEEEIIRRAFFCKEPIGFSCVIDIANSLLITP